MCNNSVYFTQFFCAEWVVKAVFGGYASWISVMKILILPINTFGHIQNFQSLNDNQVNLMHTKKTSIKNYVLQVTCTEAIWVCEWSWDYTGRENSGIDTSDNVTFDTFWWLCSCVSSGDECENEDLKIANKFVNNSGIWIYIFTIFKIIFFLGLNWMLTNLAFILKFSSWLQSSQCSECLSNNIVAAYIHIYSW